MPSGQGLRPAEPGAVDRQFAGQAVDLAAEQRRARCRRVFADDHLLAEHRHAAEGLLVAVVVGAVACRWRWLQHAQARFGIQAEHLGMALAGHRGDAKSLRGKEIVAVEAGDIGAVQVRTQGIAGAGGGQEERDGGDQNQESRGMTERADHGVFPLTDGHDAVAGWQVAIGGNL